MGIRCRLQDERGEPLAVLLPSGLSLNWLFRSIDISKTACLRFVDPYGDATFNFAQMKVLIEELQQARNFISQATTDAAYQRWLTFLEQTNDPRILESARKYPRPTPELLHAQIDALIELARVGTAKHHVYLKFIGD